MHQPLQQRQSELHEQKVTRLDICRSFAVTYDVTAVKDANKLPPHVQSEWTNFRCAELLEAELVAEPVAPTLLNVTDCARLKEAYHVVAANDWGGLPASMHNAWIASKCDQQLQAQQRKPDSGAQPSAPAPQQKQPPPQQQQQQQPLQRGQPKPTSTPPLSGGIPAEKAAKCKEMAAEYQVQPGKSWGTMESTTMRNYWKSLNCDQWYWATVMVSCADAPSAVEWTTLPCGSQTLL